MDILDIEKMENNRDIDGLINALKISSNENIRLKVVESINSLLFINKMTGSLDVNKTFLPLTNSLKDENSDVRIKAAEALSQFFLIRSFNFLIDELNDDDPNVRRNVSASLG